MGKLKGSSSPQASPLDADRGGSCFVGVFKPLKPPLTFEEQANMLEKKGLSFGSYTHEQVINILSEYNYYRMSGYWLTLQEGKAFKDGATLEDVVKIMQFDNELRALILNMINRVEVKFRTQLAYHLAHEFGADALYKTDIYSCNEKSAQDIRNNINRQIKRGVKSRIPCVVHNLDVYGALPVWAAVEVMSLGTLFTIYSQLKSKKVKASIASSFGLKTEHFQSWISNIYYVRNLCAHYARLYNRLLVYRPKLFKEDSNIDKARIFVTLYILFKLYEKNWKDDVDIYIKELTLIVFHKYRMVELEPAGFTPDWMQILYK